MELVYAAMLLHKAGKKVDEANVKRVAEAAGLKVEDTQIRALVAALSSVDIDKAIKEAAIPVAAPAVAPAAEKKEEKKEEKKSAEESAAGLSALFG